MTVEEEGQQREPNGTQRQHKQERTVSWYPSCQHFSRSSGPAEYFPKLLFSQFSSSASLILTTKIDHTPHHLHAPPPWSSPREGKLEGGQSPTRQGREAFFITTLEPSGGSTAVTWPFSHLYENIPHVGAFSFHQDVFLDVQPKHSHFLFLPISLSSGPQCY